MRWFFPTKLDPSKWQDFYQTKYQYHAKAFRWIVILMCLGQFRALSKAANVMPSETFERINAYRTKVFCGEDYKEGITSFFEKRPPEYKGKASDLD